MITINEAKEIAKKEVKETANVLTEIFEKRIDKKLIDNQSSNYHKYIEFKYYVGNYELKQCERILGYQCKDTWGLIRETIKEIKKRYEDGGYFFTTTESDVEDFLNGRRFYICYGEKPKDYISKGELHVYL